MDKEVLKGFARIGFFVGGGGLVLLFLEPHDSPEWIISLCSTMIGAVLLVAAIALYRWLR